MNKTKVVVLASGGLDSTVLIAKYLDAGMEVIPYFFIYGQKHFNREYTAFAKICAYYDLTPNDINACDIFKAMKSALLNINAADIPRGTDPFHQRGDIGGTYVPMRNTIMLSIASGIAESIGAKIVAYAGHAEDAEANYPDCTPEFADACAAMIGEATRSKVKLSAPFIHLTKGEIVTIGDALDVPFQYTYSCYRGGPQHCGICPTCIGRKKAFIDANIICGDPTNYEYKGDVCYD